MFTYKDPKTIIGLFQKAESIWNKRDAFYDYACQSILYEIISKTGAIIKKDDETVPKALTKAVAYIKNHMFDLDFSIENCLSEINVRGAYEIERLL